MLASSVVPTTSLTLIHLPVQPKPSSSSQTVVDGVEMVSLFQVLSTSSVSRY